MQKPQIGEVYSVTTIGSVLRLQTLIYEYYPLKRHSIESKFLQRRIPL